MALENIVNMENIVGWLFNQLAWKGVNSSAKGKIERIYNDGKGNKILSQSINFIYLFMFSFFFRLFNFLFIHYFV